MFKVLKEARKPLNENIILTRNKGKYILTKEDFVEFLTKLGTGAEFKGKDVLTYLAKKYDISTNELSVKQVTPAEQERMLKTGFVAKAGRGKFLVEFLGEKGELADDKDVIKTSATKVDNIGRGKKIKVKVPASKNQTKRIAKVIEAMYKTASNANNSYLLLAGEAGTGKTSTLKLVASLMKQKLITIEAPHIIEEDIISIPFVVKTAKGEEKHNMELKDNGKGEFEIVNAESALITKIKELYKDHSSDWTDSRYEKFLNQNKLLKPLAKIYKLLIDKFSEKYKVTLFIDEYYRAGDKKIKNILRSVLNGHIGGTPIPPYTYFVYASNIEDEGVDDVLENYQNYQLDFDKSTKDEWLAFIANKMGIDPETGEVDEETLEKSPIKVEVYEAFMEKFSDDLLNYENEDLEIRVSPRRWEEIIKVISSVIPTNDIEELRGLATFAKEQCTHYLTQETDYELFDKILDIIKTASSKAGVELNDDMLIPYAPKEWEQMLKFQFEVKNKLGEERKYVPILSGGTGIGKTSIIKQFAYSKGLKLIVIDSQTLNGDEVSGIPLPQETEEGLKTKFTEPPLYKQIMSQYDEDLKNELDGKYTHILFLDEFNRVEDVKIFNVLRSMLLEHNISGFELPKDIMIVGAINPTDTGDGVIELTKHTVDVLDVIPAEADYNKMISFLKGLPQYNELSQNYGQNFAENIIQIHHKIVDKLKSDERMFSEGTIEDENTKKFYWSAKDDSVYIDARTQSECVIMNYNALEMLYLREDTQELIEKLQSNDKEARNEAGEELADILTELLVESYDGNLKNKILTIYKLEKSLYEDIMDIIKLIVSETVPYVIKDMMIESVNIGTLEELYEEAGSIFNMIAENRDDMDAILNAIDNEDITINSIGMIVEKYIKDRDILNPKFDENTFAIRGEFFALLGYLSLFKKNNPEAKSVDDKVLDVLKDAFQGADGILNKLNEVLLEKYDVEELETNLSNINEKIEDLVNKYGVNEYYEEGLKVAIE